MPRGPSICRMKQSSVSVCQNLEGEGGEEQNANTGRLSNQKRLCTVQGQGQPKFGV